MLCGDYNVPGVSLRLTPGYVSLNPAGSLNQWFTKAFPDNLTLRCKGGGDACGGIDRGDPYVGGEGEAGGDQVEVYAAGEDALELRGEKRHRAEALRRRGGGGGTVTIFRKV